MSLNEHQLCQIRDHYRADQPLDDQLVLVDVRTNRTDSLNSVVSRCNRRNNEMKHNVCLLRVTR